MTEVVPPTFLRISTFVIISVHNFFSLGPIIMNASGMCDA